VRNRTPRRGFTLLEILVVLAIIVILGTVIIPSTSSFYGNTRQKAGADMVRARLADGRALAMETGTPYRVAISEDKRSIRVAPDAGFADAIASPVASVTAKAVETKFETEVTADVEAGSDDSPPLRENGFVTVVTFMPDGTCKEDRATVALHEDKFPDLKIEVRGVTGGSRTLPQTQGGGR